ncbi:MAG: hypothetical protein JKY92_00990 [Magnetovibrio sp.]|nr:hypothetical protein [Magnetovibrio sp.]
MTKSKAKDEIFNLPACVKLLDYIPVFTTDKKEKYVVLPSWGEAFQKSFQMDQAGHYGKKLTNYRVVEQMGGSGKNSYLIYLELFDGGKVKNIWVDGYGDRCNKGLAYVENITEKQLKISQSITSYDLFNLDDNRIARFESGAIQDGQPYRSSGLIAVEPYIDLESQANPPCFGSAQYMFSPTNSEKKLVSVTINNTVEFHQQKFKLQKCFNSFIENTFPKRPITVPAQQLPQLAERFKKSCLGQPG